MRILLKFNIYIVFLASFLNANAQTPDDVIVYIECTKTVNGTKLVERGTGVLISEKGQILTAKHVVPNGYECNGIPKNASLPLRGLSLDPRSNSLNGFEALLLKFTPNRDERFPFIKFCKLKNLKQDQEIFARGFGAGSKLPTSRKGIISSTDPDSEGAIQTDALVSPGMSGGPVFLNNNSNFIGISLGVATDGGSGQPSYYKFLLAEYISDVFKIQEASEDSCLLQQNNTTIETQTNMNQNIGELDKEELLKLIEYAKKGCYFYEYQSAKINPNIPDIILQAQEQFMDEVKTNENLGSELEIQGFTEKDSGDSQAYALKLSQMRAQGLAQHLKKYALISKIYSKGMGMNGTLARVDKYICGARVVRNFE